MRRLRATVAATAAVALLPASGQAHPGPLHIHELRPSIVTTAGGTLWVQVRATVCIPSPAELNEAPSALQLGQFLVVGRRWTRVSVLTEYSPWLIGFADAWGGKLCGPVDFRDLFRRAEGFAGFDSKINCLGVEFAITVAGKTARKPSPYAARSEFGARDTGAGPRA